MRKFSQNNQYVKLSGPLNNTGTSPRFFAIQRPIDLKVLLLDKQYGGGFRASTSLTNTSQLSKYPQLLGQVLDFSGKPSPRFNSGDITEDLSQQGTYIPIWKILESPDAFLINPGEWLKILSQEESTRVQNNSFGTVPATTSGGGSRSKDISSLFKYRYITQTVKSNTSVPYDPDLQVVDPLTMKTMSASTYASTHGIDPEQAQGLYSFTINNRRYFSFSDKLSYKDTDLILPRDQLLEIEKNIQIINDPSKSKADQDKAFNAIFDSGGMNLLTAKNRNTIVGIGSLARDAKKFYDFFTNNKSTLPADTVNRFFQLMGVEDPTIKKTVLTSPKKVNITIPSIMGMPATNLVVNQFTDKNGKNYYSQSDRLTISDPKFGITAAQIISLSSSLRSLESARNPSERERAYLSIIDSIPGMAKKFGIDGYSFVDLKERLDQFLPTMKSEISPDTINRMLSDKLVMKFMSNVGMKSTEFSKLPLDGQLKFILVARDALSNNKDILQTASVLQDIVAKMPGAAKVFPNINGKSLLNVKNIADLTNKTTSLDPQSSIPYSPDVMVVDSTTGKTISAEEYANIHNLNPEDIKGINVFNVNGKKVLSLESNLSSTSSPINNVLDNKVVQLLTGIGVTNSDISKLSPSDFNKAKSLLISLGTNNPSIPGFSGNLSKDVSDELSKIFPNVNSFAINYGLSQITKQPVNSDVLNKFLSDKKISNLFTTNLLATPKDNALRNLSVINDVQDGKMPALLGAYYLNNFGYTKSKDLVEVANGLNPLLLPDQQINNKGLYQLLQDSGTDVGSLKYLDRSDYQLLSTLSSEYAGETPDRVMALGIFNTTLAEKLQSSTTINDKISSAAAQLGLNTAGSSTIDQILKDNPQVKDLMVQMGILSNTSTPTAAIYDFKGLGRYYVDPGNDTDSLWDAKIVNTDKKGNLVVQFYAKNTDVVAFEESMDIKTAQNIGAVPTDDFIKNNSTQAGGQNPPVARIQKDEILSLVLAAKQLSTGKLDICRFAALIQSSPTLTRLLGNKASGYLSLVGYINNALTNIKFGGHIDFNTLIELSNHAGLHLDKTQQMMLKNAGLLYEAYDIYSHIKLNNAGDVMILASKLIDTLSNAFPHIGTANITLSLFKNIQGIIKGNPMQILGVFERDPILKKGLIDVLKKIGVLKATDTSVTQIQQVFGNIESNILLIGTIQDVLRGKVSPLVAAKIITSNTALANKLHLTTLSTAMDLYDQAIAFGHAPINPADIDAAVRGLEKALGTKIGSGLGGGVNGMSLGQIVGIANGLTMLFAGKWQAALQQFLFLIPLPGGFSVGMVFQILLMIFPGLASLFGKGGHSDRPSQNCQHCGCSTPDPGGNDNSRDYKPGGLLCKYCGSEVKSNKNPSAIAGSPGINTAGCVGYPWAPQAKANCGPHTRSGLAQDCTYYSGTWNEARGIKNFECGKQIAELGGQVNEDSVMKVSLYCQDEFAYYGNLDEGYRDSEQGKKNDNVYNNDKSLKTLNEGEYNRRVSGIIESEFKQSPYYSSAIIAFKNNPIHEQGTSIDVYNVVLQMYADLIRNAANYATLVQCGFLIESGALDMTPSALSISKNTVTSDCATMAKKLNFYWSQLPKTGDLRNSIFDTFKIKKDISLLRKDVSSVGLN